MTHRKQTLTCFIGLVLFVFAISKLSELKIVTDKESRYKCKGYTVLDAEHVITCGGDTIKKDWQILKRGYRTPDSK